MSGVGRGRRVPITEGGKPMNATKPRVAVVTGGAGGIGAEVCRRLAAAGRQVAVIDLDRAAAERVAHELAGEHHGFGLDVADTEAVRDVLAGIEADLGPVGTLSNVAGWDRFIPFVDTTPDFWDRIIAINYRGILNTTHAV